MANQLITGGLKTFELPRIDSQTGVAWIEWRDSFNIFLQVNEIKDPQKRKDLLLHWGGINLQRIYKTLPESSASTSDIYKATIKQFNDYFVAKKVYVVERLKFRAISQGTDSVDESY